MKISKENNQLGDSEGNRETQNEDKKEGGNSLLKILVIVGIILVIIFVLWRIFGLQILKDLVNYLEKKVQERSIFSYFFYILVCCCFSWFLIPGASYFYVALSFFMKNFWEPFFIIFLSKSIFF